MIKNELTLYMPAQKDVLRDITKGKKHVTE